MRPSFPDKPTKNSSSLNLEEIQSTLSLLKEIVEQMPRLREDKLMTKQDVADYLNTCVRTVDTLIAERSLIPVRIRSLNRFTRESVDRYISQQIKRK